ncbi:hypothetical protein SH528x_003089 [Novipirellula sp. SH528]|uniref:hypothetical protein n=1 Tax=Novipirellula sp. SH528 TaxID=3454466 RepID=UPI003FA10086
MTTLILIFFGAFVGLLIATFLLIAGWFAWTPLPLVFRMPLAIVLVFPFGLIASAIADELQLAVAVAVVMWVCIVAGFAADRSAAFTFCMVTLILFCILPLLVGIYVHPAVTDQIRPNMLGFTLVLLLSLALLCVPLRLLGFRLERLTLEAGDHPMRLASERSVDEWIVELSKSDQEQASFAEIVHFVKQRGITMETAQGVAKAVCRALGKPAPRLAVTRGDAGLSSWLQWATTGPRREQYSIRQLMLWVVACSILFAILARTGIDRDALLSWSLVLPTILSLGIAINLLGYGWLRGLPGGQRFMLIGGGCLCLGAASLLFQQMQPFGWKISFLAPALFLGTTLALNYWLMHLRREGFRLIRL